MGSGASARDDGGLSALNPAVADAELMRLLVDRGAGPLLPAAANTTPLMVAAEVGTCAPTEDAVPNPEVVEAVKLTLALGNDPNAVDGNGEAAMHGAAYKHVAGAVQAFAEGEADVSVWNNKNRKGWTPLHIAVGVRRGTNLRSSPRAASKIRRLMEAAGVSTEAEPEQVISGAAF